MPKVELTAVFYVDVPDEIDIDDVTIEISDEGVVYFEADGEEIADASAINGYETTDVSSGDDDDEDEEDDD